MMELSKQIYSIMSCRKQTQQGHFGKITFTKIYKKKYDYFVISFVFVCI